MLVLAAMGFMVGFTKFLEEREMGGKNLMIDVGQDVMLDMM